MSEMSTHEINEIIGRTLEQLKQARKELACLECEAHDMSKDLETMASVLRGEIKGNGMGGYFIVEPVQGPKRIDWPMPGDLEGILMKRKGLTEEIARLEEKAKQMGYG